MDAKRYESDILGQKEMCSGRYWHMSNEHGRWEHYEQPSLPAELACQCGKSKLRMSAPGMVTSWICPECVSGEPIYGRPPLKLVS